MKIVAISNYDLDDYNEKVIAENICNEYYAKGICVLLNQSQKFGGCSDFYAVKSDDYVPYIFKP